MESTHRHRVATCHADLDRLRHDLDRLARSNRRMSHEEPAESRNESEEGTLTVIGK